MILRSLALRHGRFAVSKSSLPGSSRHWQRAFNVSARYRIEPNKEEESESLTAFGFDGAANDKPLDAITADWNFERHQREVTWSVGAEIKPHYRDGDPLADPPRPEDITLELLLASQCHLGHHTSLWHPGNARYIHGTWGEAPDAIHIISLDVTAAHLRRACKIVTEVAARAGLILFVGTRRSHALPVVSAAKLAGGCHLFTRWTPGTFSNAEQILRDCEQKVVDNLDRELPGFEPQLKARAAIMPDLVVCLNPAENCILLRECGVHNIPTIGIIDTNVNPTWVTYPIPANDDSMRSVTTIAGILGRAAEQGKQRRVDRAKTGAVDFTPAKSLRWPSQADITASHNAKRRAQSSEVADEDDDMLVISNDPPNADSNAAPVVTQQSSDLRPSEDQDLDSVLQLSDNAEDGIDTPQDLADANLKETRSRKS